MTLTPQERTKIANALIRTGVQKKELAEALGLKPSWVTKLLNGTIKNITDAQEREIGKLLKVKLRKFNEQGVAVSAMAVEVDAVMNVSAPFTEVVAALLKLAQNHDAAHIPVVETKCLSHIGAELTKIVMRWENGKDPHYARIAAESLVFLRTFFEK